MIEPDAFDKTQDAWARERHHLSVEIFSPPSDGRDRPCQFTRTDIAPQWSRHLRVHGSGRRPESGDQCRGHHVGSSVRIKPSGVDFVHSCVEKVVVGGDQPPARKVAPELPLLRPPDNEVLDPSERCPVVVPRPLRSEAAFDGADQDAVSADDPPRRPDELNESLPLPAGRITDSRVIASCVGCLPHGWQAEES